MSPLSVIAVDDKENRVLKGHVYVCEPCDAADRYTNVVASAPTTNVRRVQDGQ